jgi:hypothetical protein
VHLARPVALASEFTEHIACRGDARHRWLGWAEAVKASVEPRRMLLEVMAGYKLSARFAPTERWAGTQSSTSTI